VRKRRSTFWRSVIFATGTRRICAMLSVVMPGPVSWCTGVKDSRNIGVWFCVFE